jgi:hypothetical protein
VIGHCGAELIPPHHTWWGIERAKKRITFCFKDRAHRTDLDGFNLLLSVVEGEGEIDDDCENIIDDCEDM